MINNESSDLQTSPLHSWIGVVAKNKDPNDTSIQVLIPELTPAASGTLSPASSNQSFQLRDINGNPVNSTVTTGNTITSYYLGNNSNRRYPPDVVTGEKVRITRIGNSDRYYWESLGRDDALRSTETHRIDVANRGSSGSGNKGTPTSSSDDTASQTDDTNTYSLELDTKVNKHIRLLTSKSNGEKFAYTLTLNGGSGTIQLGDDAGNSFTVDSANAKVIMRNSKNSFFILNGEDIILGAARDIVLKSGRQLLVTSPLITISAENGVLSLIATAIFMAAKSAITSTSPAIGLTGAVQIPNTLVAGHIKSPPITIGTPSSTYPVATINLSSGTGSIPSVTPDS